MNTLPCSVTTHAECRHWAWRALESLPEEEVGTFPVLRAYYKFREIFEQAVRSGGNPEVAIKSNSNSSVCHFGAGIDNWMNALNQSRVQYCIATVPEVAEQLQPFMGNQAMVDHLTRQMFGVDSQGDLDALMEAICFCSDAIVLKQDLIPPLRMLW